MFRLVVLGALCPSVRQCPLAQSASAPLDKITRIRDIDTFEVDGLPIRLDGVDGPELKERDGPEARDWLIRPYSGAKVPCRLDGKITFDRHAGNNPLREVRLSEGRASPTF
jgi:endonuclease YncB( thermonuclease family)